MYNTLRVRRVFSGASMILATLLALGIRIISLAPSLTEDLFAIGAGPDIIATDSNSNRPAAARALPKVGVMMGISAEKVMSLHPDVVVGIPYQAPILAQLARLHIRTAIFADNSLEDALATIDRLGRLSGRSAGAHAFTQRTRGDLRTLAQTASRLPRVAGIAVVGTPPIYAAGAGTFIDGLLQRANIRNVAAGQRLAWPALSAEQLLQWQPQIIVVPSDFTVPDRAPWTLMYAVKRGCVISVDADDLLRPGPSISRALRSIVNRRKALASHCN